MDMAEQLGYHENNREMYKVQCCDNASLLFVIMCYVVICYYFSG